MIVKKKPIPIEAVEYLGHGDFKEYPEWLKEGMKVGIVRPHAEGFFVKTKEGEMEGKVNDMLMQGIKGELYPCDRSIFDESYEPA